MLTIAVNLNHLIVRFSVVRRPIRELCLAAHERVETGIAGCRALGFDTATHINHRFVAPPALALEGARARRAGPIEQSRAGGDDGPAPGFTEVIDAAPEKLAGIGRVVAKSEPDFTVVAVFGAENLASRFGFVRGEDFVLAIILTHDIEKIRKAVVVIVANVWTK